MKQFTERARSQWTIGNGKLFEEDLLIQEIIKASEAISLRENILTEDLLSDQIPVLVSTASATQEYVMNLQFKQNVKESGDKIRRMIDCCEDKSLGLVENAQVTEQVKGIRISFESTSEVYEKFKDNIMKIAEL